MRSWFVGVILALGAGSAGADPDLLSGGGAFDAIAIGGFILPVQDVQNLMASGVLTLNAQTRSFAFGPQIKSERDLAAAIAPVPLERPMTPRDLFRATKLDLPNGAAHDLTIPSGFGPGHLSNQKRDTVLSAGFGGVSRVPYTSAPDGALGLALSFGNAYDGIGTTISMSFNDLSQIENLNRISWGVNVSHYISDGVSISAGGENLAVGYTDGQASYYVAGSWAFGPKTDNMPFKGQMTLGAGNGRFADMTPRDVFEGKRSHATTIFGSVSWEVDRRVNLITEWNGRNLNAGIAFAVKGKPISFKLGAENLTGFSGNGPILTGSISVVLARF